MEHVRAAISKGQQLAVRELRVEADLGIPKTAVSEILTQYLSMKPVRAKFVPWLLLPDQEEPGAAVAKTLGELREVPQWASLSCVQRFLYLVSSSVSVSIFHIAFHIAFLSRSTT